MCYNRINNLRKGPMKKGKIATIIVIVVLGIMAVIAGASININIENGKTSATITFTETENEPEVTEGIDNIEYGQGEIKLNGEEIKTVEAVESNGPVTEVNAEECAEGEECGRGAYVPTLDISSPQAFANQTLGVCIDADGYFGAQCWDSMAAYFINYTGHTLYTCGTGAAKGTIAEGCWQQNAGNEFTMIWNATQIQPGDIAVFSTGQWGHIGMVMGYYNNGYFTLLGQNQGGAPCPGGGAAGNIINISTRDFIGAFRPNIYIKPEPQPEPRPEPQPEPTPVNKCESWEVQSGDTLGDIMIACEGTIEWGEAMDKYAESWVSEQTGNTVFYGWAHDTGYGLIAGETITKK